MEEKRYYQPENGTPAYRSKAEVQIARLLDRERIAFRYEHPLAVIDRGRVRIWYPDFYLPEYGTIVEYFGMNGDPGYRERAQHKVQVYGETGIDGVFLTEESFTGDWPGRILGEIEGILQRRLDRFYQPGRRNVGTGNRGAHRATFQRP